MYSNETQIINSSGLHARPASEFVALAKGFKSKITVKNLNAEDASPVNAKSIVLLLAEGMGIGTRILVCAEGEDERAAVDSLTALVASGFGE